MDLNIICNGKCERGRGFLRVQSELVSRAWREGKDDLGWPCVHFIASAIRPRSDAVANPKRKFAGWSPP